MDGSDGSCGGLERLPDSQPFEDAPAGIAQRSGALVEAGLRGGIRRVRLDQRDAQRCVTQCGSQACPDQTAADDGEVVSRDCPVHVTRAMAASMAEGWFGTPPVST